MISKRLLPVNIERSDIGSFEQNQYYQCPPMRIYNFKSINALPDGTLFKWLFPLTISFLFFRKRIRLHNIKGIVAIRLNWKKLELSATEPFLIIHDAWTQNYYHWITQALPRLMLAQKNKTSFQLLLPNDHQSEFHTSSLHLLGVTSWRILQKGNLFYKLQNLWYAGRDIQIGDYHSDSIIALRDALSRISEHANRNIFIHRTSQANRRIINQREVLDTFVSHGFEIVEFEKLSFEAQLILAGQTRVLAGVHGAGLTNMIFMPKNSVVFELTTRVGGESYYYYTLSNVLAHRYYYQKCNSDANQKIQEADLFVDIDKLSINIKLMLAS